MRVTLISIGDELLTGRTVNTNAAWLGERLAAIGRPVHSVLTIGDDLKEIAETIEDACTYSDLVVLTGGLGPTEDDVTREALCALLDCGMTIDQGQLTLIRNRFAAAGRPLNERTERQARVPEACQVIPNYWGTAPGLTFRRGETTLYVLPGVPAEMRELFSRILEERIPAADGFGEQVWLLYGIPESLLSEHLEPLTELLGDCLSLAYLPSDGTIRLRLIRYDGEPETMDRFGQAIDRIEEIAGEWIVSNRNETLAEALSRLLSGQKLTIATAESCTGGMIGAALTDIPGSSLYFPGGIVSYGNREKEELLGVTHELIAEHGAVSEPVARAMAAGVRTRIVADYSVAVTGIAGPGGGTPEKPVGTIWVAVASARGVESRLFRFKGERDAVRRYTVNAALATVLARVREEHSVVEIGGRGESDG